MRTLLALLVMLWATAAHAGGNVGVVVTGEPAMQPQLAAQLEGWLRQHGHKLIDAPLPPDAVNTLIDCFVIEDEGCARGVVDKRARSATVVFARIEVADSASSGMRDITVTAYWFDKGRDLVAERRFCARCTEQTLRNTADEVMSALAGAGQKDVGHLKLSTIPSGARVMIDGQPVGATPLEYSLAPGEHAVTITRDHHEDTARQVTIRKGETSPLEVTLTPVDKPGPRVVPVAMMAGGAAVLVTGILVYRLAEPDTGTTPEFHDDRNHALGIGIGVAGLAVAGVGAYMFFTKGGKSDSAPSVAVLPGGAYVGWTRSF
jgi:hypothetical protein